MTEASARIEKLKLLHRPGQAQLIGFRQVIIDRIHHHPHHTPVRITQGCTHRRG